MPACLCCGKEPAELRCAGGQAVAHPVCSRWCASELHAGRRFEFVGATPEQIEQTQTGLEERLQQAMSLYEQQNSIIVGLQQQQNTRMGEHRKALAEKKAAETAFNEARSNVNALHQMHDEATAAVRDAFGREAHLRTQYEQAATVAMNSENAFSRAELREKRLLHASNVGHTALQAAQDNLRILSLTITHLRANLDAAAAEASLARKRRAF